MFISFAGIECCGKTTLSKSLDLQLTRLGHRVTHTREPGGTKFAEQVRNLLLDKKHDVPPMTEALMFYAGRIEHTQARIIPALNSGHVVITDRYYETTLAYQTITCGMTQEIHDICLPEIVVPDMVILIDIPASVSTKRLINLRQKHGIPLDRLEERPEIFFEKARQNFLNMVDDRYLVLDGTKSLQELESEIVQAVLEKL